LRIQLIDTPGLLDRPFSERNKIELKAVFAIKHLADALVFLVDPSPGSYYDLPRQLSILEEISSSVVSAEKTLVAVNKVDACPEEAVENVVKLFSSKGFGRIHKISALKGEGLEKRVEEAAIIALEGYK